MKEYFFDTYALFEISLGNTDFIKYIDLPITTFQLNLIELYNSLLGVYNKNIAQKIYQGYLDCVEKIDDETVFEAVELRRKLKKRNVSYVDCLGHIHSKRNNMLFLTGDKEFKDLPNVEFVK